MKNGASPFLPQTFVIGAGEVQQLAGQYNWLEILSEFETESPSVNSGDIAIAFNTMAGPNAPIPVPPGFTVIADVGYPIINPDLVNTGDVSITVTIVGSAGPVGVDHRIIFPVGSLVGVTVTNTDANPVPVQIDPIQTLPVIVENAQLNKIPANAVPCIGTDCFDVTATTILFSAVDNVNGAVIDILELSANGSGSSAALTVFSGAGTGNPLGVGGTQYLVAPNPIYIPPGWAATITIVGADASAAGSFRVL